MGYNLVITERFEEKLAKFLKKHPKLSNQYWDTIDLLEANPYHNSLRLHKRVGKLKGLSEDGNPDLLRMALGHIAKSKGDSFRKDVH